MRQERIQLLAPESSEQKNICEFGPLMKYSGCWVSPFGFCVVVKICSGKSLVWTNIRQKVWECGFQTEFPFWASEWHQSPQNMSFFHSWAHKARFTGGSIMVGWGGREPTILVKCLLLRLNTWSTDYSFQMKVRHQWERVSHGSLEKNDEKIKGYERHTQFKVLEVPNHHAIPLINLWSSELLLEGLTETLRALRMLENAPKRWKEDELNGNSQPDKNLGRTSVLVTTCTAERVLRYELCKRKMIAVK